METERVRNVSVSTAIMQSMGIRCEQLMSHLVELESLLGCNFEQVVPSQINDIGMLHSVVNLSICLRKLKLCSGFNRHVKQYVKEQVRHSYFVADMGARLYDRVDQLELEPAVDKRRVADMRVAHRGSEIYLECKTIESEVDEVCEEHDRMFAMLKQYLSGIPHQICITYKQSLSDEDVRRLGDCLKERASLIRADGTLIDNSNLNVHVVRKDRLGDTRLVMRMPMTQRDLTDGCTYLGHTYAMDGLTVSIAGPKADYKDVLRTKVKDSRGQYRKDCPFVLLIDANSMSGSLAEHIRALATAFQPGINTRFSGAALVESALDALNTKPIYAFHLVANPFAKFPMSKEFERLLCSG